ncbi:MinD/ParA family ATP-binding protein [Nonomuraea jiangxiensis]|uniref:MinD-like ATPase involved in chromosome partitioning or flagellar assembly n=1 Tax=Nonomuraea jiangxiensis TaxID=633440 RepID=A0A1G9EHL1_9ACTN|nr:MinD/ParA family protein [Nonomuraea jiangxiensis]SDK75594.1 MinD-like ATPase involved in chromosome partitioning or flagellar assembly [Nonomuraea jiangxiensis]
MARHDREESLEEQLAWLDAIKETEEAPVPVSASAAAADETVVSPYPQDPWLLVPTQHETPTPPLFRAAVDSVYGSAAAEELPEGEAEAGEWLGKASTREEPAAPAAQDDPFLAPLRPLPRPDDTDTYTLSFSSPETAEAAEPSTEEPATPEEPDRPESAHPEPAHTDPSRTDPVRTESTRTELGHVEDDVPVTAAAEGDRIPWGDTSPANERPHWAEQPDTLPRIVPPQWTEPEPSPGNERPQWTEPAVSQASDLPHWTESETFPVNDRPQWAEPEALTPRPEPEERFRQPERSAWTEQQEWRPAEREIPHAEIPQTGTSPSGTTHIGTPPGGRPHTDPLNLDQPYTDPLNLDRARLDTPHPDRPRLDTPHPDRPRLDTPHPDRPRLDTPHPDTSHIVSSDTATSHTATSHTASSNPAAPHTEALHSEAPHAEAPHAEAPHTEAPRAARTHAAPPARRRPAPIPVFAAPPRPPVTGRPTADSLDPETLLRGRRNAPAKGWRRLVYRASGGWIKPGEAPEVRRRRQLMTRARTPVTTGHHRVAVLSLKGGVGKTTTTVGLGATLAQMRGDRVIAVDANPDRGTLSDKLVLETSATVRDLLNERDQVKRYVDIRAFTSQAPSRLEVLASDRDPSVSEAFSGSDYQAVSQVLENFYSICITDCGTGLLHSAMGGVLGLADQVVLVSSPSVDGARAASATLDWLEAHHYGDLVKAATVVLCSVRPRSKSAVDIKKLEAHFAARCRAVIRVPYDPHLEEGAEIDLDRLQEATREAYLQLAACVGDGFAGVRE